MNDFPAFKKIWHLGTIKPEILLSGPIEITEKYDGSQFAFGKINGQLRIRSKGQEIFEITAANKMFAAGVEYVKSIEDRLPDNVIYYCEYFAKSKHNCLTYERLPKNHLVLFGRRDLDVGDIYWSRPWALDMEAVRLDIDCAQRLHVVPEYEYGPLGIDSINELLTRSSSLGGEIEGIVIKNYDVEALIGGQLYTPVCCKYVSERFKEVHKKSWKTNSTVKGKWEDFKESYRTEPRWMKAVQHLRDNGQLTNSPKDIGALIKEIHSDIITEEKDNICKYLWNEFGTELLRKSIAGFPEWYKQKLVAGDL
jgi:hypothetical protein